MLLVLLHDLSSHRDLSGFTDLGGDFLRADFMELIVSEGLDGSSHSDEVNKLGVHDVIGGDLGQLGEMPSVPFLQSHGVVVKLFVKIFEEGDGLNNHSVNLIGRERELVTGHGMGETELHGLELVGVLKGGDETLALESNASHHFVSLVTSLALDAELLTNGLTELFIGDEEFFLNTFLNDVFVQKLRQTLGHLTLDQFFEGLHGVLGILELGESLHLDDLSSTLGALEVLVELLDLLKLLFFKNLEEGKTSSSLKKYVHFSILFNFIQL